MYMYLGIDYGGTNLKVGIFNEDGSTVKFIQERLSVFVHNSPVNNILEYVKQFSKGYNIEKGGLAIKGLVDTETGFMLDDIGAGSLLSGINLTGTFSEGLNIPFKIENDARAYAWGEYKFGAGKGSHTMVCVTLGTGVGCSVISNDKPFYGADVLGGLLGGHISIDINGPDCPCGNKGCLELYCSATAYTKTVVNTYPEFEESANVLEDFFNKIRNKEVKYFNSFNRFIEQLSVGIVNVIHAYGPDTIVIGGGVMNSSDLILPALTELVNKRAWTYPRGKVKIKASSLGSTAAALGVAFL
jgi:glucokinase